jgi:pyrimidine operon attenuation protein/uracil phosphoribosyltransferase
VLPAEQIERALNRIAHEIVENAAGAKDVVVLGIPSRGVPLANRIASQLEKIDPDFDAVKQTGQLDITMYRDDLQLQPPRSIGVTHTPDIDNRIVVLVDDVLFSGRTIRAALNALNDLGRPQAVRLATLVDRGHRELPIRPDFVGKDLPTSRDERVRVKVVELDGIDCVEIEQAG